MEAWVIAHLIGDFILQTDKMAKNKKGSWKWVIIHGMAYIVPFIILTIIDNINIIQCILIFVQHILQDKSNFIVWMMKKSGSKEFATGIFSPWSICIVDNIVHITFIWFVINMPLYITI